MQHTGPSGKNLKGTLHHNKPVAPRSPQQLMQVAEAIDTTTSKSRLAVSRHCYVAGFK